MIDTIIFDLDGTLLDTLEDLTDSVNYVMGEYDLPPHTIEEIRNYVGNGAAKLIERAVPKGIDNPAYEKMLEMFRQHYAAHCEDKVAPYDGVMELLASLKAAGYRTAIVSNKPDSAVKQLYERYFKEYVQEAVAGARYGVPSTGKVVFGCVPCSVRGRLGSRYYDCRQCTDDLHQRYMGVPYKGTTACGGCRRGAYDYDCAGASSSSCAS